MAMVGGAKGPPARVHGRRHATGLHGTARCLLLWLRHRKRSAFEVLNDVHASTLTLSKRSRVLSYARPTTRACTSMPRLTVCWAASEQSEANLFAAVCCLSCEGNGRCCLCLPPWHLPHAVGHISAASK